MIYKIIVFLRLLEDFPPTSKRSFLLCGLRIPYVVALTSRHYCAGFLFTISSFRAQFYSVVEQLWKTTTVSALSWSVYTWCITKQSTFGFAIFIYYQMYFIFAASFFYSKLKYVCSMCIVLLRSAHQKQTLLANYTVVQLYEQYKGMFFLLYKNTKKTLQLSEWIFVEILSIFSHVTFITVKKKATYKKTKRNAIG